METNLTQLLHSEFSREPPLEGEGGGGGSREEGEYQSQDLREMLEEVRRSCGGRGSEVEGEYHSPELLEMLLGALSEVRPSAGEQGDNV